MNATRVRAMKNPRILRLSIAILILLIALMAFFQGSASATVFSVNNFGDAVDMFPGDGLCMTAAGLCTLRAAIMETNALPGPDVIVLSMGIYNLSIVGVGEDSAVTGDLDITDSLTILGTGMSFTVIDGLDLDRVFHIAPTPADFEVSIQDLTIRRGNASPGGGIHNAARLTLDNVSVLDNYQGGIYNEGPALTLIDSEVRLNSNDAGIMSFSPVPPSSLVTLTNTNVEDNQDSGVGCVGTELTVQGGAISGNGFGGVWGNGCEMTFNNVMILNNTTPGDGGGIMSANYAPVVNGGVVRGNQAAGKGGGIYYWGLVGHELQMTGVLVENNEASMGGGLYIDAATATLDGVTLRGNRALEDGGGIYVDENNNATLNLLNGTQVGQAGYGNMSDSDGNNSGVGAGIYSIGTINLENSAVSYNTGVGIWNEGPAMMFTDSVVSYNDGEGIYTFSPSPPLLSIIMTDTDIVGNNGFGYYGINGDLVVNGGSIRDNQKSGLLVFTTLAMTGTTVSGNGSSSDGGGLYLVNVISASINDSTISGNSTQGDGGGIYYWGLTGGELSLTNVTLSGNMADGNGGAIIVASPPASTLTLTNVTISDNQADADVNGVGLGEAIYNNGTVNSVNSVLEGDGSGPNCAGSLADFVSQGHNISSDASCPLGAVGDQPNTDPLLGLLQDNGGPTETHALPFGSPAINAGDDIRCPPADQRGVTRPQGVSCDVGAFEMVWDMCALQTEIPESECRALEDLYNSTDGDSWTDNTKWLITPAPCSWFGVTCTGGHVYAIDLSNNGLDGAIPPSMGNLVELDTLILHENQLSGSIPLELGSLSNLRQLGAYGNQLEGSIPPSLGNLTKLAMLQLGFNQLSGPIPPELGNLANLINLGLSRNQLSGSIPPSLGNLTNLEQLVLSYNQLSGPIPPELGSMPSLTYLVLMDNQLSGPIPPELGDLIQLNYLNLNWNELSGSIPPELGNMTNLIQLGLDSNQLGGSIPASIGNLTNLEFLQLGDNQLSGTIPSNFGNLVATEFLTLNDNPGLTGPLPLTMTNLVNLNTFRYYNTDLCEPPDAAFQAWLGGITELMGTGVTCAVDVCAVQTEIPESECRVLENLYNSTDGHSWTDSTGWFVTETPCSWFGVSCSSGHVSALQLVENNLNGPLPESLVGLTDLRTLDLSHNLLTGSVPTEYGTLSSLELLGLSYNLLSGSIPPELGDLKNLTNLELGFNDLSGSIPPELGNLANLVWLYLFDNRLSGDIPPQLGNLAALQVLYVPNNQLTGTIPPELGNLTNLLSLGLDNNQLSDPIPAELGNLTGLRWLTLGGNQLSGAIPIELGNLSNLKSLLLGGNQLSGTIPIELGNLTNLNSITLHDNQLGGEVPAELGNLVDLQQLWLQGNISLTGPLPLSLTNLAAIQEFFYYDTDLCNPDDAVFQAWLAGISDLRGTDVTCAVDFCAVQTEIPEIECRALEDLYNSTDGDNWTDNTGWLATDTPCSWYGVTCAAGHVTEINMLDNRLSGVLPDSLADLSELMRLSLFRNQLTGSIPPHYGSFTALTFLDLSENQLSGSIPPELGNLSSLQVLSLGYNQLSGPIPPELGNLTNVTSMLLEVNQLSGNIPPELGNLSSLIALRAFLNELSGPIPPELGNLSNLVTLVFGSNKLSGDIPPQLGDLTNLKWLNLSANGLTGSIPIEIANLTELENLHLANNQLDGAIPAELGNLINLTQLLLQNNQLVGTVPVSLGNLVLLENLNLAVNPGLTGPLPLSLTNLAVVQVFNYYDTDLCNPQDAAFQAWLVGIPDVSGTDVTCAVDFCAVQIEIPEIECRALEDLYNSTDGDNWTDNTDWLSTDTPCSWFGVTCSSGNVTVLDLNSNQLSGPLPASLSNLGFLNELHLWNNQLNGTIPPELGILAQIDILTLAGNQLTGSIPPELGNMAPMRGSLNLDNNNLSGPIPFELGNLTNLTSLGLFNNQLTGPVPAELGNLTNLLGLYLSGNQLSGELPDELGNLLLLRSLWLHDNPDLTGMLPLTLADLLFMETFYFDNTDLCEPPHPWFQTWLNGTYDVRSTDVTCDIPFCSMVTQIPQQECEALVALYASTDGDNWNYNDGWMDRIEPCTWIGLYCQGGHVVQLNLQGRGLNGTLPPEIDQLEYLELLRVRDNQLQGTIPPEVGGISQLEVLDLSRNQFAGNIPTALGSLGNLRDLALSENLLTGSLPASLGQLTNLEYLILYDNQLSGAIPPELGSLSVLVRMDLENNQFTGTLPPELGNLVNLIYLYLGNNQISGVIPAEFGNMAKLEFLRLWSNQLTGPLPPELGNLPNLISLYLPNNQLTGALPAAWENFASIREILVFDNPLSGPVPMSYINLSTLNIFEFQNTNICEPPEPVFQDWLNNLSFVSSTDVICPNTGVGTDVTVVPIDYASGTSPVTVTFANVLWEGYTSLEITDTGPEPPDGFMLGDPPTYYQLDTTAAYYGVEICIDYSGISYADESTLALYHYEGGEWVNVTTFHDMVNDIICGESLVLSPFAVFEEMNKPPSADANGPYAADEGSLVSFDGTGSSDPDGDELIYDWDFGDGEVGSGATPAHAYGDDGVFTVTLEVNDPGGLSDSASTTATISNVAPSVDAGDDATIFSGDVLYIEADFVDPGRLDTHTATIDFGTGEGPETATVAQGTGSGTVKGSHRYLPPGNYNVEVCVTDDDGGVGCDTLSLAVLPLPVEIDVKPDGDTNAVNCKSEKGVLTVAILTTQDFDATTVDHTAVTFEGASETHVDKKSGEPRRHEEDVDGDGDLDLVFHFRFGDTDLTCDSVEGRLKGETFEGIVIEGVDSVRMVGDKDS